MDFRHIYLAVMVLIIVILMLVLFAINRGKGLSAMETLYLAIRLEIVGLGIIYL